MFEMKSKNLKLEDFTNDNTDAHAFVELFCEETRS